jgi:predicted transcriptional regulator/transcriptional regulator with XRE-family HTH domain
MKNATSTPSSNRFGARVRSLRRRHGLNQVELSSKLGISPSYLNLIEHNHRTLTAPLLLKLAQLFPVDLAGFVGEDESRIAADLQEVFGDAMFEEHDLTTADVRDLASNPQVARAIVALYHSYQDSIEARQALASLVSDSGELSGIDSARLPSEEVSDVIQKHLNYFPAIEEAAEKVARDARLNPADAWPGLARYLEKTFGVEIVITSGADARVIRRYDPEKRKLHLSEILPPRTRNFQLAHQIGLFSAASVFSRITASARLTTPGSAALCRIALANYFAGALLMPYAAFYESACALRYDIELLGHRFRTSFEQVCQRLTTLRRPGSKGVPFHFIRVDIAGNISKRFSASGIRFARFSGLCPKWNVHAVFMTPEMIRTQLSRMPDGTTYLCVSRTVRKDHGGYGAAHTLLAVSLGCEISHARELVYADGLDLTHPQAAVPIGITCRLCDRVDCEQRAFPAIQHRLAIDENYRGASFYSPAPESVGPSFSLPSAGGRKP